MRRHDLNKKNHNTKTGYPMIGRCQKCGGEYYELFHIQGEDINGYFCKADYDKIITNRQTKKAIREKDEFTDSWNEITNIKI
jgi:hypothetical protein